MKGGPTARRPAPIRSRLALAAAGLCLGLVLAELGLRAVLFGDLEWGYALRHPARFTAGPHTEDYWRLWHRWRDEPELSPSLYHPRLGWVSPAFDPGTLAHEANSTLGSKRPVLLYGDSFARCATEREACFGGLLAASDLGATHALLNFGVRGYGVDQIARLALETVGDFASQDPLVIVAILVDEDLDRSLAGLRQHPKPRARLEAGALCWDEEPVPTRDAYLAAHPPAPRSWLWSLVASSDGDRHADEARELNRAILDELRRGLGESGVEWMFLLCHGPRTLAMKRGEDWREAFLEEYLRTAEVNWLSSRRALEEGGNWFDSSGHWNARGNAAVFELIAEKVREIGG